MNNTHAHRRIGFTLIEMLITIAIIAVLIGILLPVLTLVRQKATKTACMSNLRQIGLSLEMYADANGRAYPVARYMPEPFLSINTDPPLPKVLRNYFEPTNKAWKCPGDQQVHALCGSSYYYNVYLAGKNPEQSMLVTRMNMNISQVPVGWDFDGGVFELMTGQIEVEPFHALRNILFADTHVGNYE